MMWGNPGYGNMMYGYSGSGLLGMFLLMALGTLFLVLLTLLIVRLVRRDDMMRMAGMGMKHEMMGSNTNFPAPSEDPALTIAKARFAKGEITKEEFETIRNGLLS